MLLIGLNSLNRNIWVHLPSFGNMSMKDRSTFAIRHVTCEV